MLKGRQIQIYVVRRYRRRMGGEIVAEILGYFFTFDHAELEIERLRKKRRKSWLSQQMTIAVIARGKVFLPPEPMAYMTHPVKVFRTVDHLPKGKIIAISAKEKDSFYIVQSDPVKMQDKLG